MINHKEENLSGIRETDILYIMLNDNIHLYY
jgi:hypothetical protein